MSSGTGGYGRPPAGESGGHHGSPGHCVTYPHEIECVHISLELILKVAVQEYVTSHAHLRSQAPWFDAFKHVSIPPGSFTKTCLSLLSSEEIRENLKYCFKTGGHQNRTYVPSSPAQMYRDLCKENAVIQEQLIY